MIGRLRQLSEPRLRQKAEIEKSQTHVERELHVQWVRKLYLTHEGAEMSSVNNVCCIVHLAFQPWGQFYAWPGRTARLIFLYTCKYAKMYVFVEYF